MPEREMWRSRAGFLLAAVGSAVGLGNIWQFPFKTATNGGATFVIVYLLAIFFIGLPALLAEFIIGRRTNSNVVDTFEKLGHRHWRVIGGFALLTNAWIFTYYTVVGGWTLRYLGGSVTGAYFANPAAYFETASAGFDALAVHALFMAAVIIIVALGVRNGIERATKVLMPTLVILLIGLAVYAATLPNAGGYSYFLAPDVSDLRANFGSVVPFALGQAFLTLSLGMGIMITYSSYISRDESLLVDGGAIVIFNTLIGLLAGFVVFPLLFAQGVSPETSGAGAVFVSVATAFADLPAGRILGFVFFLAVFFAALTSAISMLEAPVSYIIDNYDIGRAATATGVGGILFLLGIPSALNTAWLTWSDTIAFSILLPFSVFGTLLFVGWILADDALSELGTGSSGFPRVELSWLWMVRVVVLIAVGATVVLGIREVAANGGFIPPL